MRPLRPAAATDSAATLAFDSLDDGLLVLDSEDGILAWNPAFARAWALLGVPLVRSLTFAENLEAAAAIGRSGGAAEAWLAHRRAAPETAAPCLLALSGGLALRIAETAIAAGRHLVTCRDVTAERQREGALKDSEYRYRLLVETITEGLIVLDRERRIVYANPRFLSWYGSGDMALLGRPLADLTTPPERERLAALFSAAAPRAVEIPLVCVGGAVRFALVSAAPLRAAEGGVSGHFAVITDVTDLRRASERLRDSEGRFRSIIESTPFGILTLDGAGRILSANPAFRVLAGADLGEDESAEARLPEATPPIAEMMERLAREPQLRTVDGESRLVRGGCEPGHARLLLARMGEDGGFLMVVEDVTERRRMEEVLRHASKLALLGEMSASLAHEISQPLNVIRLAAESALLSLEDGDAAAMRAKFEIIGAQSDRLRETIDYMQGFSRRDAGPRRCFDLRDAVEAALGMVLPQCANRGIAVARHLPDAPLPVLGHARQAEQVLINLLNNAVDAIVERRAARAGGADEIVLSARIETPRGAAAEIRLEIADTGTGIREEDMPHLFDPFFTRKTEGAGTGLGLSISLGLVTAMGGRIEVENRPEGGCRFRVALPARLDTPVEPPPPAAAAAPPPAAAETPPMAVLVVDDEELATREIAAFLKKSGHTAFTAASGRQAHEVLAATHIDILITDLRMPDGDGFQLIAEAAAEYPHIGLVVMTGQPLRDREALAELENGVDAILRKPVSLRELAETLRSLA
ncbi:PAS domain S-box protein [Oleispirillum naphthae]|uniref:PAS domain-containing hybrid sensor histidine kinase/response regulator n=1 Tax=Oleispirillum naphthae TaxID=2838853 RepID=UPI0030824370